MYLVKNWTKKLLLFLIVCSLSDFCKAGSKTVLVEPEDLSLVSAHALFFDPKSQVGILLLGMIKPLNEEELQITQKRRVREVLNAFDGTIPMHILVPAGKRRYEDFCKKSSQSFALENDGHWVSGFKHMAIDRKHPDLARIPQQTEIVDIDKLSAQAALCADKIMREKTTREETSDTARAALEELKAVSVKQKQLLEQSLFEYHEIFSPDMPSALAPGDRELLRMPTAEMDLRMEGTREGARTRSLRAHKVHIWHALNEITSQTIATEAILATLRIAKEKKDSPVYPYRKNIIAIATKAIMRRLFGAFRKYFDWTLIDHYGTEPDSPSLAYYSEAEVDAEVYLPDSLQWNAMTTGIRSLPSLKCARVPQLSSLMFTTGLPLASSIVSSSASSPRSPIAALPALSSPPLSPQENALALLGLLPIPSKSQSVSSATQSPIAALPVLVPVPLSPTGTISPRLSVPDEHTTTWALEK